MSVFELGMTNGEVDYSIPFSDSNFSAALAPNQTVTFTIPKTAKRAVFSCTGDQFWVGLKGPITPPTATVAAIEGEQAPAVRNVEAHQGQALYVMSVTAETITVSFYD